MIYTDGDWEMGAIICKGRREGGKQRLNWTIERQNEVRIDIDKQQQLNSKETRIAVPWIWDWVE